MCHEAVLEPFAHPLSWLEQGGRLPPAARSMGGIAQSSGSTIPATGRNEQVGQTEEKPAAKEKSWPALVHQQSCCAPLSLNILLPLPIARQSVLLREQQSALVSFSLLWLQILVLHFPMAGKQHSFAFLKP